MRAVWAIPILNEHGPLKKETLRHNNECFLTKELRKEIMKRSKLKNLFNKNKNQELVHLQNSTKLLSESLISNKKKQYCKNLDI